MRALLLAVASFLLPAFGAAQDAPRYKVVHSHPMTTCIVTGEALGADPLTFEAAGRTFQVCSEKCRAKVEKDVETFSKKVLYARRLDAAVVAAQESSYPLDVCTVSGKKLGSAGNVVKVVLDETLVKLCCSRCVVVAMDNPEVHARKVLDAAYALQLKAYPTTKCVVSGEELGDKAVDTMVGARLVRTCCDKCAAKVAAAPKQYVDRLQPAQGKEAPGGGRDQGAGPPAAPAAKPAPKAEPVKG